MKRFGMHTIVFFAVVLSICSQGLADVTRTLALVKPHALKYVDEIKEEAGKHGFQVIAFSRVGLDKDSAQQFYLEHAQKPFYEDLVKTISSGPLAVMVLERQDAVAAWRRLIGPTDPETAKQTHKDSIRARYGESILLNAVHGSSDVKSAKREISYFFPPLGEFAGGEGAASLDEEDYVETEYDEAEAELGEEEEDEDSEGGEYEPLPDYVPHLYADEDGIEMEEDLHREL